MVINVVLFDLQYKIGCEIEVKNVSFVRLDDETEVSHQTLIRLYEMTCLVPVRVKYVNKLFIVSPSYKRLGEVS